MKKKRFEACSVRFLLLACCLAIALPFYAQARNVRGVVYSQADDEPIIGANIVVKGSKFGTVTDIDGAFSIMADEDAVLEVSYIGFVTQEIRLSGQSDIKVFLAEDTHLLEQVVVTGYTTQRKADLTGAISVVNMDEIQNVPENNPIKALQGRVAGMSITADGNPSGASTVRIRGIGTLNNNDPLYIIDGVPTKAGMHELNPNDIASIQVLKDASSASIYGSRAGNGVIIITTKGGKKGETKVNFDAYVTSSFYGKDVEMMNTAQYGEALFRSRVNAGLDPNNNTIGYLYDYTIGANGYATLNGMRVPQYVDSYDGTYTMPSADTDWFDELTRTGFMQSYNLSLSHGSDKANTFFSLGYLDNKGTVKTTEFSRISARLNSSYKLFNDQVTIGENFTLNRTQELSMPGGVLDMAKMALPIMPVKKLDGDWASVTSGMNDRDNPMRVLDANKNNPYTYWRLFGNAYIDIEPIKNLHLKSNFGVDYGNFYQRSLGFTYSGRLGPGYSTSKMGQRHWMKWNWSNTVTYDLSFGKNRMDFLVGMEMFNQQDISFDAERRDYELEIPDFMWPDVGTGEMYAYGNATGYKLLSFFGKVNYVYDDRYLLSATVRRDGSSRFGKQNRFGTFPAFSAGWRISEENFMEDAAGVVSDLKLRAAWGQTGNQEIDNLANRTILVPSYNGGGGDGVNDGTAYDIEGNDTGMLPSGYKMTQRANDNIRWETTTMTNVGIDFAFFNSTLYGTAEWYLKNTKDILVKPAYLGTIGEGGDQWVNGASMENQGIELSLGYRNKTAFGLEYDVVANVSGFRNKITDLPESVLLTYGGTVDDNILGRPINSYYGYVADGLFRTQDQVDNYVNQPGKGLGRIRYANLKEDGIIDINDRTWLGDPHPKVEFGLNVYLAYKGFDLTMFFQGLCGNLVQNNVKQFTDFWAVAETGMNKGVRLLDAFDPVSNPNSDIPMISYSNDNDEGRLSTYYLEPGSYLKLRNLQVGYSLPKSAVQKIKFDNIRFYVSGQNLFTVKSRKFTGLDPENPNLAYPISTSVTIGLNVQF